MKAINRREFLGRSAAATALLAASSLIPSSARGADGRAAPSERIAVGLIGRGRMGRGHLKRMLNSPGVQVVAVCDVDRVRREEARNVVEKQYGDDRPSGAFRGCVAYNDYRELLARPDIDAVIIATPDHWHAVQAIDAAKAGKDVYCEKPISLTIQEGRRTVEVVRRYDRVFQTGTQRHSNEVFRKVCRFIREGHLGKIKAVYTTVALLRNYVGGSQFASYRGGAMQLEKLGESLTAMDIPLPAEPVPEGLDWDLWVGPAPWRPYNHCYHTNETATGTVPWNFCADFGHGGLCNHTVHSFDLIQWALGVEESGPVEVIHPNTGDYPTLTYKYANGTLSHMIYLSGAKGGLQAYNPIPGKKQLGGMFGGLFVGERGWIDAFADSRLECQPKEVADELGLGDAEISESEHTHHENWLECIRTRRRPVCDVEIGHRAASVGHVGDIAWWTGRSLKWDAAKEEFIGDEEANRLRSRVLRAPWRI
jgi:predicted dehydrogenase